MEVRRKMSDKNLSLILTLNSEAVKLAAQEIEDSQFTKIHFRIYSADRINAHGYVCPLKVLRKYAKTIAGKPILTYYNKYADGGKGDFAGHEDSAFAKEYAVGFFPQDISVSYEKDDNGTIFLCADGFLWNVYAKNELNVFENAGGIKGVSCEMLIIESELIEDTGIEEIQQYSFAGLTLLGNTDAIGSPIRPAVEGCMGEIVRNSVIYDENFEKAKNEFEKILYNSTKTESDNSDSFLISKNEKEENMAKEKSEKPTSPEVIDNATQIVSTEVKVSTDTVNINDKGEYVGEEHESHKKEIVEVHEVPDNPNDPTPNSTIVENAATEASDKKDGSPAEETKQDNAASEDEEKDVPEENPAKEENACKSDNSQDEVADTKKETNSDAEKCAQLEQKCAELEKELNAVKEELSATAQKCAELTEYKNNKESEIIKNSIDIALNDVSDILNKEQMNEWREKSLKCSVDSANSFINELKAFAFDIQDKSGVTVKDTLRNSLPVEPVISGDMWDVLAKKYN